jgi:hypothetical protein
MVVVLRKTNRLAMHLASNGHALYQNREVGSYSEWVLDLANPVEVEFFTSSTAEPIIEEDLLDFPHLSKRKRLLDRMSWLTEVDSEDAAETTSHFPFPPQSDRLFDQLDFLRDPPSDRDKGYEILPFQDAGDHSDLLGRMKRFRMYGGADILWLSATEFVSLHRFHARSHELELYSSNSYAMSVGQWKLLAYSLPQLDNTDGVFRFGPVSDLPLRFLYHVLAPIFYKVYPLEIEIAAETPVEAALTLVPRTEQSPLNRTTIFFPFASTELLHALSSFPFHHRVRLQLEERKHSTPRAKRSSARFPVPGTSSSAALLDKFRMRE